MSYSEDLKNPKWQKKRLEILNLHNFTCEQCGAQEKTLHVHHSRYIKGRKVWEYDNDVLMCLCEDCHRREHVEKIRLKPGSYSVFNNSDDELIFTISPIFEHSIAIKFKKYNNSNTYHAYVFEFTDNGYMLNELMETMIKRRDK